MTFEEFMTALSKAQWNLNYSEFCIKAGFSYDDYSEAVLPKLAPRGLIAVDNTLWSGRILDPADESVDTVALRRFNEKVAADPRVVAVLTTVRDGVTLIRRAG